MNPGCVCPRQMPCPIKSPGQRVSLTCRTLVAPLKKLWTRQKNERKKSDKSDFTAANILTTENTKTPSHFSNIGAN